MIGGTNFFGKLSLQENYKNSLMYFQVKPTSETQKTRFSSLGQIVPPSQILMIHRVLLFAKNLRQPTRLQECCFRLFFCVAKKTDRFFGLKVHDRSGAKAKRSPQSIPYHQLYRSIAKLKQQDPQKGLIAINLG